MKVFLSYFSMCLAFLFAPALGLHGEEKSLALDEAIARALKNHPGLLASGLEVRAREAGISQAGVLPNPEFSLITEDFGGSGAFHSFDSSQTTLELSQRIELGGKRGKRRNVASANRDLAMAELQQKRREVVAGVRKAFLAVLLAQDRVRLMQDLMEVSLRFSGAVREKIQAGKIPPIDEMKSNALVASAEIDVARSRRELDATRYNLAAAMGATEPDFDAVSGELVEEFPETPLQELLDLLPDNPEMLKAALEMEEKKSELAAEKSKAIPDLMVAGGYRLLNASDDHSFVIGASIPLPFFDRNKGGILEAQHRVDKGEQLRTQVELRLRSELNSAYQLYAAAAAEANALRERVLPANQISFDAISEGYRLGKYGYLDVLESQRSLFQSRLQLLNVLGDLHSAATEIERITGMELPGSRSDERGEQP